MKTSGQSGSSETITSDEMRVLEQEAIASGRVSGLELMERAGKGVVEAIFEKWPELAKPRAGPQENGRPASFENSGDGERLDPSRWRAAILCGPGNNGGDGFVIARLLAEANWNVIVHFAGNVEALPPDAKANYMRWAQIGQVVFTEEPDAKWEFGLRSYDELG
ncbi:NAD(P)H-hydrate epimerase, partial [Litoreibacter halocynthiae]|uniref:NAD(P)H-hydrate epimerase n=1 Tax=Litoreibacter halocynthiae TaxID=1242689 RepID=UPI0024937C1E